MTGFINYLINGISLGSVYAIIALGYTMVYGIAKMLNFAHGDIIMVGSYVVFITTHSMGMPVFLSVLLSVIVCTVLGIVIERVAYKPLRDASPLSVLITAIGVSYLLQNVALLLFGADTKSFTSVVTIPALKFADGAITVTGETLVTIVSCIVIMIGLTTFINKTKAGQAMLAVSEDRGAATLMGVNQYKAKGSLTDILLPIVALDDAVGLIVFAVSFGIAKAMNSGVFSVVSMVVNPLLEIVMSLVVGALLGWIFHFMEKRFHSNSKRLTLAVAFVILASGLAKVEIQLPGGVEIGFSSLLMCMMLGTIFCNLCDFSEEIMYKTDRWTAPLYVLFFVLSGAELDLRVFGDLAVVGVGLVYIIARSAGKYFGASYSSRMMKCEPNICKYLGLTLLPQAGVALGMSVTVAADLGAEGAVMRDIVLFSVLIYELVGPMLTKWALTKSGDIRPKPELSGDAE